MVDVPPIGATIASGKLNRFVIVPDPLLVTRINDAFPGNVAPEPISESTCRAATVPPTVTLAAAPRVTRSPLPAPEIVPPELTDREI